MDVTEEAKRFVDFLDHISDEEMEEIQIRQLEQAEKEFDEFSSKFEAGSCYLCGHPIKTFNSGHPCLHWLLKPKGFKKKHFKQIYEEYSYTQISSYLRWVANHDSPFTNINDLAFDRTGNKIIELTIKYRHLEWSFSCSESDYNGHQTSQHARHPHYHFQMRIDHRPFINYNDFHATFHHRDLIEMEAEKLRPDEIKRTHPFGEGMEVASDSENIWDILENSSGSADEENGMFDISSMVYMDDGRTIDGDMLVEIIDEAREKDVPIATLIHKLGGQQKILISPGGAVPEKAPRTPARKKKE
jgi:hypothetical protein